MRNLVRLAALFVPVLVVPLLAAPQAIAQPVPHPLQLRVMTYNIQHGAGFDGQVNLNRTATTIAAQHPDLVGLQEVDDRWGARSDYADETATLAAKLHMHAYFAEIYDLPPETPGAHDRRYGLAILSRYQITNAQNHHITRLSTQTADPKPTPGPGFPEIEIDVHGEPVHIYTTHLDYRPDPSVRKLQVTDMLAFLANDPAPTILVGDLNAEPSAPELASLLARQTDVWTLLNKPHPPSWPADKPTVAIDFITVSAGIVAGNAQVIDDLASDHRPEIADITIP